MLLTLMDGTARPAGELAFQSRVSPQTASEHLAKMVKARLLRVEVQGKHRYYRLSGPKVATLLECLSTIAPVPKPILRADTPEMKALRFARSCYNHLAGEAAVQLNVSAQQLGLWRQLPDKRYRITQKGADWLENLGIGPDGGFSQRGFARACLDWTERRHHIGGQLGSLLLARFFELDWIVRVRDSRCIRFTERGFQALNNKLGLRLRPPVR